jgi:hypothetical protein
VDPLHVHADEHIAAVPRVEVLQQRHEPRVSCVHLRGIRGRMVTTLAS